MDEIPVVDPEALDPEAPVPGLDVRTPFRTGGYRLDVLVVDGGESGWHRSDGPLYGWVRDGRGRVEYDGGEGTADLSAGDFLRIPDGVVRRYAAEGELELLAVTASRGVARVDPTSDPGEARSPAVVGPDELVATVETPALTRETPFPGEDVLLMRVRAAGGAAAGWHHHGENVYFGYAVDGPSETEYGHGENEVARIELGECFHVPTGLVHRDTNPTDEAHTGIVWLCGGEPWVVNVDGPD